MHINCCNANGPRGFAMIPAFGIKTMGKDLFVNYFGESNADIQLGDKNKVSLRQSTSYPESGTINMEISPEKSTEFSLNLRIPDWSKMTTVKVNDKVVDGIISGTYLNITRTWSKGDIVIIELDMRGKLHLNHDHQAITRGPIVLARDSRLGDGFIDETSIIQQQDGIVELTLVKDSSANIWMTFTAPCKMGTDLEGAGGLAKFVKFCDFASAGNTWDPATRYRVWLPKTLNVMEMDYEKY